MDIRMPGAGSNACDRQTLKRWAAEHFAISIGLLRECPYHGEPFKPHRSKGAKVFAPVLPDPRDPLVKLFNGNAHALYAAAERLTGDYGERCPLCAASEEEDGE
jgi:hypothetical protein